MKLRLLSILTVLALLFSLVSCNMGNNGEGTTTNGDNTTTTNGDDTTTTNGDDTTTNNTTETTPPDEIRIYTLNGTTGFGMAKLMNDAKANEDANYTVTVKTDASEVTAALINGDVDIAALPTNAASNVYNKTNGGVKILAVNTLGCLYLLTNSNATVTSFADLKGKTVYAPAQNPTFILKYLCEQNGLTVGTDVKIDSTSYAQPAALKDAVAAGLVDIAVLPEPMVTIAISTAAKSNITITNAMDLTAEWNKVAPKNTLVQGCVVVRTAFLEAYPTAVEAFLKDYEASINYLSTNLDEAAQMIVDNGIFNSAPVAKKAIPKCNVCFLDGAEMKAGMETYLGVLKNINANAIGGALPLDDFYYVRTAK